MQSKKSPSFTKNNSEIELSLILACYNESGIFNDSMKKIEEFFKNWKYSYELIFVDDKSTDNTAELIKKFAKGKKNVKTFFHEKNQGRGKTVSDGIKKANGKIVGFVDVDLEVPIEQTLSLIEAIKNGSDIAIGKRIYVTKPKYIHRHILSKAYSLLSKVMLAHPFFDTEAGCKFFNRKKILPFLSQTKENHWFWDTEIVLRPYFAGLKIIEVPVLFIKNENAASTVKIFADTINYLKNLWKYSAEFRKLSKLKRA
ncbi:MAG: glycosyltransferase [Candidatus Diapherotrites archaeon]